LIDVDIAGPHRRSSISSFPSDEPPNPENRGAMARRRATVAVPATDGCEPSIRTAPLDEPHAEALAARFAALADPARLRVLSILAAADAGEVCACDLVEPVGRSQPTVSHHLKVLYEAGLVDRDKRGTWMWYRLVPERLDELRRVLS
jgi:ArsR family transcriptional regulator